MFTISTIFQFFFFLSSDFAFAVANERENRQEAKQSK